MATTPIPCEAIRCSRWRLICRPLDRELCSQSTISRLENLPDVRALLRMGCAMIDLYCASFHKVPRRITLDIDDTFDAGHGGQQLRLFNAHMTNTPISAHRRVRRRGPLHHCHASSRQAARRQGDQALPTPLVARDPRQLAQHRDPAARRQPLLRPRGSRLRRANGLDYILGVALTAHCAGMSRVSRPARRQDLKPRQGGQGSPFQGVRRREKLELRRADHCPRRSVPEARHALRRHQSQAAQSSHALRGWLLPARSGRKSHQILEDASGGGSHVLHKGHGQSASAVPARRRLLDHVGLGTRRNG